MPNLEGLTRDEYLKAIRARMESNGLFYEDIWARMLLTDTAMLKEIYESEFEKTVLARSKRRCWFWSHQWSHWQTIGQGTIQGYRGVLVRPQTIGAYEWQRRECARCGRSQLREVSL